jgi:hypothetical protein
LGRFNQVGASSGVGCGSCSAVVSKLCKMSDALSSLVWFLGTIGHLFFYLSSSNRNQGKAFAVLFLKAGIE